MKYLVYLCLILATVEVASGLLHKLFKKEVEKCETEYIEKCTDEYTEECWDEVKDVCHNHPECQTTFEDRCEQLFKKQCHGGSKKGKKWRRDVAEVLVNGQEDDEEFDEDELKKISTAELLDIVSESHDESNDNDELSGSSKQKRHIHHKIAKLLKKKGKESCEHIPVGEQCEKVPVEHCRDVEKCSKEIIRECKQVPHQKCWQEPQENCWQVPVLARTSRELLAGPK